MPEQTPQPHQLPREATSAQADERIYEALLSKKDNASRMESQKTKPNRPDAGFSDEATAKFEAMKMQEEEEREKLQARKEKFYAWANKVGLDKEEVNENARFTPKGIEWNGDLDLFELTSLEAGTLPEHIDGDLNLSGLTSLEAGVLPDTIGGAVYLTIENFTNEKQQKIRNSYPHLTFYFF